MNKVMLAVLLALPLVCATGCSANGRFYPVVGPLSTQTPPPVFPAKFTIHLPSTLSVVLHLANGESATGSILRVFPVPKGKLPPPAAMPAQWDAIYGQGSYVATVLGVGQDGQGVLTGTNGTTLNVEIHTSVPADGASANVSRLKGVAEDNKGNLYKIAF